MPPLPSPIQPEKGSLVDLFICQSIYKMEKAWVLRGDIKPPHYIIRRHIMNNPIQVFEGTKDEFDALPVRQQFAWYSIHIARSIELLLKLMNEYEDDTVVSDGKEIITEIELHEHIVQYMKLSESLFGDKPTGENH